MKLDFKTSKDVEKYLKTKTDKEFVIINSGSKILNIVISRNDKLIVFKDDIVYFSWIDHLSIKNYLKFINQK